MLTRLRQICCSPSLYLENFDGPCAKIDCCLENLSQSAQSGHKTLVFSQFKTMLDILYEQAKKLELKYLFLSDQTSKEKRRDYVKEFQSVAYDVFFISLKAGGTGLNLTAADRVIHFDPWWNFVAEDQATDRTHRIGQQNHVFVKKLVAKDTIEERIIKMQEDKRILNDSIILVKNLSHSKLNKNELLNLLKIPIKNIKVAFFKYVHLRFN